MTLKQSSAVHIQALVSADGILLGISCKHQLLIINLASVPGGQLVNSPTAQSLVRQTVKKPSFLFNINYRINYALVISTFIELLKMYFLSGVKNGLAYFGGKSF